ncbi:hypothetical protein TARUN_6589 [Trichoderma arundinaceum]|uniref:Nephrocystin 3-like N-terminal domain-containing protein n=1 Tax=Trichoderma arundinaceum TaxID=490622 RepID=A0A395NI89_TRIAR|nr:hypothetical protein TARUN_6589 [Trichoderma arundinaceum]
MDNFCDILENHIGHNASIIQGDVQGNVCYTNFRNGHSLTAPSFEKVSATDLAHDKQRIMTLKGPFFYEAFSWILNQHDFKRWREANTGVFWTKGDPGKGKTMLLCGNIEELEKVLRARPALTSDIQGEWEAAPKDHCTGPNAWFSLRGVFEAVIKHQELMNPVRIVDALDECE